MMLRVIELLKVVLSSWALVILILGLIYRRPIRDLLDRILELGIKGAGFELHAGAGTAFRQKDTKVQEEQITPDEEGISKLKAYGRNYPIVDEAIRNINGEIDKVGLKHADETTYEILVRWLATMQWLWLAERLYRLIFGSQITLLRQISKSGSMSRQEMLPYYEKAVAADPSFYAGYSFDDYLTSMQSLKVIAPLDKDRFALSQRGSQFLTWMAAENPGDKPH
jgi:hypothetical protein